jgi:hypothetical protein
LRISTISGVVATNFDSGREDSILFVLVLVLETGNQAEDEDENDDEEDLVVVLPRRASASNGFTLTHVFSSTL